MPLDGDLDIFFWGLLLYTTKISASGLKSKQALFHAKVKKKTSGGILRYGIRTISL
jgi:hypothetical protein